MLEVRRFYMPSASIIGPGALADSGAEIKSYGFTKALIVTDKVLEVMGLANKVVDVLSENGIESKVYSDVA